MTEWIAEKLLKPFAGLFMGEEDPEVALSRPLKLAVTSLIPFIGPNATMYLEQDAKFILYWVIEAGLMLGAIFFFPFYILFKIILFIDVYQLAKRKKAGRTLQKWEFFWN